MTSSELIRKLQKLNPQYQGDVVRWDKFGEYEIWLDWCVDRTTIITTVEVLDLTNRNAYIFLRKHLKQLQSTDMSITEI